jgi:hypothetical protein
VPTYCYKCDNCDAVIETPILGKYLVPCLESECGGIMRRDWKGENVNVNTANLRAARG